MIDTSLNVATVVTQNDATWLPYPGVTLLDVTLGAELKQEFASPTQLAALLQQMTASGIDISQLQVVDSANNWDYPSFKKIVYLRSNGPKLYSLKGTITVNAGTLAGLVTYIDINVGSFINQQRLLGQGNPLGLNLAAYPGCGDTVSVFMVNPFFPWLYWGGTVTTQVAA